MIQRSIAKLTLIRSKLHGRLRSSVSEIVTVAVERPWRDKSTAATNGGHERSSLRAYRVINRWHFQLRCPEQRSVRTKGTSNRNIGALLSQLNSYPLALHLINPFPSRLPSTFYSRSFNAPLSQAFPI